MQNESSMQRWSLERIHERLNNRFWQSALGCRARQLLGYEFRPSRFAFIIGCYNSGTTLLQSILGAHPAIASLPREGTLLTDQLATPEHYHWPRAWYRCLDEIQQANSRLDDGAARLIRRQWSFWYSGEDVFLEKSISNLLRAEYFQRYFSPAYFIHIVRNGYCVAEGISRKARVRQWKNKFYSERYPVEIGARQWVASQEYFHILRSRLDRVIELRYEDLTAAPSRELGRIFEFLGVKDLAGQLGTRDWAVHNRKSPITDMNGESFGRLTPEEIRTIREIAAPWLRYFGYEAGHIL